MSVFLIDSYEESNKTPLIVCDSNSEEDQNGSYGLSDIDNGHYHKAGQCFTGDGGTLDKIKLYLCKRGSPTGNAVIKIYAMDGTFGTSGVPIGAALATSDNVDVSILSGYPTYALQTFEFGGSNRIKLVSSTHYCLSLEYDNGVYLVDRVYLGVDYISPTHDGNSFAYSTDSGWWLGLAARDCCFYVYTTGEINLYSGSIVKVSQSFRGMAGDIVNAKFYLKKVGSPSGNITAVLYAHNGSFGSSSVPTGAALATSDNVDISDLSTSLELITFNFTGVEQYTLSADTKYTISLEYSGGNSSNYLVAGFDFTSPEHVGNYADNSGSWSANSNRDLIFYVYAEGTEVETADEVKNIRYPLIFKTTKELLGPWTANMRIEADDEITPEGYVKFDSVDYIVKTLKKIKTEDKEYFDVGLYHNMGELSNFTIERFKIKDTVSNHLAYILTDSNWSAGTCDITATVKLVVDRRISVLEALYMLADKCNGELDFDSANRTVDLKEEIGTVTKRQLRVDKNLNYLEYCIDTKNLITRLFPSGPDNLPINTIQLENCDDATNWTGSGGSTVSDVSIEKMEGSGAISFIHSDGETLTTDKGLGNEVDLSGIDKITFRIYDNTGSGLDFDANAVTFGLGESAWNDDTIALTGSVNEDSWRKVEVDISGIADADKNAIRHFGFEGGGEDFYVDDIRAEGNLYIDSDNREDYKINKEDTYFHSASPEILQRTVKIYPSADSLVYLGNPNSNFGSTASLKARDYGPDWQSFIKFDLSAIPSGATITSANLYLYCYQIDNGGQTVNAYLADADWYENTITWNNQPSVTGGNIKAFDMTSTGWKNCGGNFTTTVQNWFSGAVSNYGVRLKIDVTPDENKTVHIYSREGETNYRPYLLIAYTLSEDEDQVLKDAAENYLAESEEPAISIIVRMVDLSRVIADTWEDETISLGDTIRLYDKDFGINVDCRVKKIIEDLLDPSNTIIELTNKLYDITESQAKMQKKLSKLLPFADKEVMDAGIIQKGYIGGGVGGI